MSDDEFYENLAREEEERARLDEQRRRAAAMERIMAEARNRHAAQQRERLERQRAAAYMRAVLDDEERTRQAAIAEEERNRLALLEASKLTYTRKWGPGEEFMHHFHKRQAQEKAELDRAIEESERDRWAYLIAKQDREELAEALQDEESSSEHDLSLTVKRTRK